MPDLVKLKRREAKALGLPRYFTGKPCPRGHVVERYTCGLGCVECAHRYRSTKGHSYREPTYEGVRRDRLRILAARRGQHEPPPPESACPAKPALCDCCGRRPPAALDHCHVSGLFRGWLCSPCNTGIGSLGDDLSGLIRAVDYLKRSVDR